MAVKKLYSNFQSAELRGIPWSLKRIEELKALANDYGAAQARRDAFNQQQQADWDNKIKRIKEYTEIYHSTMGVQNRGPQWAVRSTLSLYYFQTYRIDEITGNTTFSNDIVSRVKPEQPEELDKILDPKNIKIPDKPIPIYDVQHFIEPIQQQIRELEYGIEKLKTETSNKISASQNQPIPLDERNERWLYQDTVYEVKGGDFTDEKVLLILEFVDKDRRKFERLKSKFSGKRPEELKYERVRIPEEVRIAVWRRDQGKCARCGSRENLEYDHIVPVSKGGGNTERNIELLCQDCNRAKGNRIE